MASLRTKRINALDGKLGQCMDDLQLNLNSFRSDMLKALRLVERQMVRMSGEIMKIHAGQQDLEDRLTDVEKKAS